MSAYRLPLETEELEEGGFLARCPVLPGLNVQAETIEEVERLAPGVAKAMIEAIREKGVPLPVEVEEIEAPFRAELLVPA